MGFFMFEIWPNEPNNQFNRLTSWWAVSRFSAPESKSNLSCVKSGRRFFNAKNPHSGGLISVDYPNGKAVLFLSTRKSLPGLVQFTM